MRPHPERFLARLERRLEEGVLPVRILSLLESGPTYGYALMERLRAEAPSGPTIGPSSLYPALARLRQAGLVVTYHGTESLGPVRKYYELTPAGLAVLPEARAMAARIAAPTRPVPPIP